MKEVLMSILILAILSVIARRILPKIDSFVKFVIKRLVKLAEKRITGSKMGATRKAKVLKWLGWFNINSCQMVDDLINATVDIMNSKQSDITSSMKDDVSGKFDETINKVTNKSNKE